MPQGKCNKQQARKKETDKQTNKEERKRHSHPRQQKELQACGDTPLPPLLQDTTEGKNTHRKIHKPGLESVYQ